MIPTDFEFDHVGVAVESIVAAGPFYTAMGLGAPHLEEVASEGVKVAMYRLGNGASIELLEPLGAETPVGRFLSKRGPGIHHICLRVKDLRQALEDIKSAGYRLINEVPKPGAHGCQVAFIHPSSTGGVLIELSQPGARS